MQRGHPGLARPRLTCQRTCNAELASPYLSAIVRFVLSFLSLSNAGQGFPQTGPNLFSLIAGSLHPKQGIGKRGNGHLYALYLQQGRLDFGRIVTAGSPQKAH